jgi:hypothetical protein
VDTPESERAVERPPLLVLPTRKSRANETRRAQARVRYARNRNNRGAATATATATASAGAGASGGAHSHSARPPKAPTHTHTLTKVNTSGSGTTVPNTTMSAESERQYAFGWKRYSEYCVQHGLDPLVGEWSSGSGSGVSPAQQVMQFAKHLMQNPEKPVRPAAANSYVSAVGKKLVDAKVSYCPAET